MVVVAVVVHKAMLAMVLEGYRGSEIPLPTCFLCSYLPDFRLLVFLYDYSSPPLFPICVFRLIWVSVFAYMDIIDFYGL